MYKMTRVLVTLFSPQKEYIILETMRNSKYFPAYSNPKRRESDRETSAVAIEYEKARSLPRSFAW